MRKELVAVFDALADAAADADPGAFDVAGWVRQIQVRVRSAVQALAAQGSRTELTHFGKSVAALRKDGFRIPDPVQQWIDEWVGRSLQQPWWGVMEADLNSQLAQVLRLGTGSGESGRETAQTVRATLRESGRARAERIVRTETTGALNAGHQAAREHLERLGVIRGKKWLCIHDGDTRPDHLHADGQEVGVSDGFVVGGERGQFPGDQSFGPSQRIHCRCTSVSVLADHALSRPRDE